MEDEEYSELLSYYLEIGVVTLEGLDEMESLSTRYKILHRS